MSLQAGVFVGMTLALGAMMTNSWLVNKSTNLEGRTTRRVDLGAKAHRECSCGPTSKCTMEEVPEMKSALSSTIKSWKYTHHPSPTEISEVSDQLADCADIVRAIESTSLQSQIHDCRFQQSVAIKRRERLETHVGDMRQDVSALQKKFQESEILLNLYDLSYMFIYYTAEPAVTGAGFSSYEDFVATYAEKNALVLDGEMTEHDFNLWLKPVRDALGAIDIAQLISVCPARHAIAPVEIRAKLAQKTFLGLCQSFDFGSHAAFASKLIEHLSTVPLQRMT
eukprot:gene8538-6153_t